MATLEQLERGIRAADRAGNAEDVRRLGTEYRRMQREQQDQTAQADPGLPLTETQRQAVEQTKQEGRGGPINFLTGGDRTVPDLPELNADDVFGNPFTGENRAENFRVSAGTLLTFDDEAQRNIWDEQLESAGVPHRWEEDPFGNAVLVYKGPDGAEKMGYLNSPGVSGRDIATTAAQVGGFLGAGRAAKAIPGVGGAISRSGLAGRTALTGSGAASQSAATDAAANMVGADISGVEMGQNAAIAGGLGAGASILEGGVGAMLRNMSKRSALKKTIAEKVARGSTDNETAKYMLDGHGKLIADPTAKEAIRQGVDEGVVAAIKGSKPADRQKMSKMLGIIQRGKGNQRFSVLNRPSDVVGDSLVERFNAVKRVNRRAGNRLDSVAKGLKGEPVDVSGVMDDFVRSLDSDLGVKIADGKLDFRGSTIEGLDGPEKFLRRLVGRLRNTEAPDAYDVHRMKKFIDEQVSFGKSAEGLSGKTETAAKKLRRQLDGLLDQQFPEYNQVNTEYAETIGAMDAFQKAAGSTIDLASDNADKALGTLSRRLMSNAQSRVRLIDAIEQLQSTASKYGQTFDDDVVTQALFVDELERVFGPAARTSLQGEVEKGARRAATGLLQGDSKGMIVEAAGRAIEHARGINEESAMATIRQLLKNAD